MLFIGHRLDEVRDVADRVPVLRGGRPVAEPTPAEATEARMIRVMVGGEPGGEPGGDIAVRPVPATARTALSARGLTMDGPGPVDLDLRAGEVVGVAGPMGSGRSRLLHTRMGAQPRTDGEVELNGRGFHPRHPADAVAAGVGLVPEDREEQSLLLAHPVRWNATPATLRRNSRCGGTRRRPPCGATPGTARSTPGSAWARSQRIVADLGGAAARSGAADRRPVRRQQGEPTSCSAASWAWPARPTGCAPGGWRGGPEPARDRLFTDNSPNPHLTIRRTLTRRSPAGPRVPVERVRPGGAAAHRDPTVIPGPLTPPL